MMKNLWVIALCGMIATLSGCCKKGCSTHDHSETEYVEEMKK